MMKRFPALRAYGLRFGGKRQEIHRVIPCLSDKLQSGLVSSLNERDAGDRENRGFHTGNPEV
jgi:hypothetical protein